MPALGRRMRLIGLALLLLGCTNQNEVRLVLDDRGSLGLQCVDSMTGESLLVERGRIVGGAAEFSVAVDYLAFEGVPSCRPQQLLRWCNELGCPFVTRDCVDVRLDGPIPDALPQLQERVLEELAGLGPVTRNAPDGVVVIRMVISNQTCADVGDGPHRCDDLLGCVYSCPVQLDEVDGIVLLELDSLGVTCDESIVGVCAGIGFEDSRCVD